MLKKLLITLIIMITFTSCAVLNFPDQVHEEIYNQVDNQMLKDIEFGHR